MKGLFPQYDSSKKLDYKAIWRDAIFVFDTNVLLNLYRYQENTRDELLGVLSELSEKIWIPFHVALEFQRNRMKVIAAQGKKFSEIRKAIEKFEVTVISDLGKLNLRKRHTLIDPDHFLSEFEKLTKDFLNKLSAAQKTQQKLTEPDALKDKIESLFENRVGPPLPDQKTVDELFKNAEQRYKFKIPPGYMDSNKDEDSPDEFVHNNIIYKRKFGDYLVWRQLLDFAKKSNNKTIVFVTDDAKEDWWQKYNLDGPKTVGPRPELIEEARISGGIDSFVMYNPEGFLQYSKDYLKTKISESTLEDVRDTSIERRNIIAESQEYLSSLFKKQRIFKDWKLAQGGVEHQHLTIDFLVEDSNGKNGYEIRQASRSPAIFARLIKNLVARALNYLEKGEVDTFTIVFILDDDEQLSYTADSLIETKIAGAPTNLLVSLYTLTESHPYISEFAEFPYCNLPEADE